MEETSSVNTPIYVNMEAVDVHSVATGSLTSDQSKLAVDNKAQDVDEAAKATVAKSPIHEPADNATLITAEVSDASISSAEDSDLNLPMGQPPSNSEPPSQQESQSEPAPTSQRVEAETHLNIHPPMPSSDSKLSTKRMPMRSPHLKTIEQSQESNIRPSLMDSDSLSTLEHSFAGILKSLDKRIADIKKAEADEKRAEQEAAERAACEIEAELSTSFESISTKGTKLDKRKITFTVDNTQLKDEDGKSITLTIGGDDQLFEDPDGILNLLADPTNSFGSLTTNSSSSATKHVAEIVWPSDEKSPEGIGNNIVFPVTKVEKNESGAKLVAEVTTKSTDAKPDEHISMLKPMLSGGKWKKGKVTRHLPRIQIKAVEAPATPITVENVFESKDPLSTKDCTVDKLPEQETKDAPTVSSKKSNTEQQSSKIKVMDEKKASLEAGEGLMIKEIEIPTPKAGEEGFFKDSPSSMKKEAEEDIKALAQVCSADCKEDHKDDIEAKKKAESKDEFCNLSVVSSASLEGLDTFDASTMTSYDDSAVDKAIDGHDLDELQQKAKLFAKKATGFGTSKDQSGAPENPDSANQEKASSGPGTPRASNIHTSAIIHPQRKDLHQDSNESESRNCEGKRSSTKSRKKASNEKRESDKYACYISFEYSCNALEKLPDAFCSGLDQTVETVSRGRLTSCGELKEEVTETVACNTTSRTPPRIVISCNKGLEISLLRETDSHDSHDTEGVSDSDVEKISQKKKRSTTVDNSLQESDSTYLSTTDQYGSTTFDDTIVSNSSGPNPASSTDGESDENLTDSGNNTTSKLVVNTAYSTSSSESDSNGTQWYSVSSASLEPYKSNRHGGTPRRRSPKKKGYSRDEVSTPGRSRKSRGSSASPRRRNKTLLDSAATPKSGKTTSSTHFAQSDIVSQNSTSVRTEPTMQETWTMKTGTTHEQSALYELETMSTINTGTTHEQSTLYELETMSTMNSILGAQSQRIIPSLQSDLSPARASSMPSQSKTSQAEISSKTQKEQTIETKESNHLEKQIPTCPSLDEKCKQELAALDSLMQSLPVQEACTAETPKRTSERKSNQSDNSVFSGLSSTCRSRRSSSSSARMSDEEFGLVAFKLLTAFPFLVKQIQSFSAGANHQEIVDILPEDKRMRFFTAVRQRASNIKGNPKSLTETLTMDCQNSGFGRQGMDNPITAYFATLEYHKNLANSGLANVINGSKIDEDTKLQFQKNAELSISLPQAPNSKPFPKVIQTKPNKATTSLAPLRTSYDSDSSLSFASARSRATRDTRISSKSSNKGTSAVTRDQQPTKSFTRKNETFGNYNSATPIHSNAMKSQGSTSASLAVMQGAPTPTHSNASKPNSARSMPPHQSQIHFLVPRSDKSKANEDFDTFSQISESDMSRGTANSKTSSVVSGLTRQSQASSSERTKRSVTSTSSRKSMRHGLESAPLKSASSFASVKSQNSSGSRGTSRSSRSQASAKSRSSLESTSSFVTAKSTLSQKSKATTASMKSHHSNQTNSSRTSLHSVSGRSSVMSHHTRNSRQSAKSFPLSHTNTIKNPITTGAEVDQSNYNSNVAAPESGNVPGNPIQERQAPVVQAQIFNFADDQSNGGQSHISLASTEDSSCMTYERNQHSESSYVSLDTLKPMNVGSLHMTTIEEENYASLQAELTPRGDPSKLSFAPSPKQPRSPRKTLEDQIKDVVTNGYDMSSIPPSPRMFSNGPKMPTNKAATGRYTPSQTQPSSPKKKAQQNTPSSRFMPELMKKQSSPQYFSEESEDIYVVNSIDTQDDILECNSGNRTMYHDVEEADFRSKHVRMALGSFD